MMKFKLCISVCLYLINFSCSNSNYEFTPEEDKMLESLLYMKFEKNKTSILPIYKPRLDSFAIFLKKYPEISIKLTVRPNKPIELKKNIHLSNKREAFLIRFFNKRGISSKRINTLNNKQIWRSFPYKDVNIGVSLHW